MSCMSLLKWLPSPPWPVAAYKFSIDYKAQRWFITDEHRSRLVINWGSFLFPPRGKMGTEEIFNHCVWILQFLKCTNGMTVVALTLLFSVGSRESSVLLSTSPISSSDTLIGNTIDTAWHQQLWQKHKYTGHVIWVVMRDHGEKNERLLSDKHVFVKIDRQGTHWADFQKRKRKRGRSHCRKAQQVQRQEMTVWSELLVSIRTLFFSVLKITF